MKKRSLQAIPATRRYLQVVFSGTAATATEPGDT